MSEARVSCAQANSSNVPAVTPRLPVNMREKLQRDRMAEPQIVGLIDDTHAAASELPDDPIAARQRRAVGQCRVPEVREVHSRDRRNRSGGAQRIHRGKRLAGVGRRQMCRLEVEERSAAERTEAASLWSRRITG